MKTTVIIAVMVFVFFLAIAGFELYKKGRDADKLEYELHKADIPDLTVNRIISILDGKDTNPVLVNVVERIINPTSTAYTIDQMNLSFFTESGELLVKQKEPLSQHLQIKANSNDNLLELSFMLNPSALKALVQEAGGIVKIGANRIANGEYGINFRMKGTISSLGFTIDLDEIIPF